MTERERRERDLIEQLGLDPLEAALAVAIADGDLPDGDVVLAGDDETTTEGDATDGRSDADADRRR